MRALRSLPLLAATLASACDARTAPEDSRLWWDAGLPLDVTESVAFTDTPYDFPEDERDGILELREDLLTQNFDNDGPYFAEADYPEGAEDCPFWESSRDLPRTITGIVTSNPRVYEKLDGCGGDDKFYGSYWLEDRTGGIFVLSPTKVAHFSIGAKVTLEVRSIRRRYGIDMVYVSDVLAVEDGPFPIHYTVIDEAPEQTDQSTVMRADATVVTAASGFGEVLVQIDGAPGRCAPDNADTRADCLPITLDQDLTRRGLSPRPGDRLTFTGPVSQSAYFGPTGVTNFYGLYISRLGQIAPLGSADSARASGASP